METNTNKHDVIQIYNKKHGWNTSLVLKLLFVCSKTLYKFQIKG